MFGWRGRHRLRIRYIFDGVFDSGAQLLDPLLEKDGFRLRLRRPFARVGKLLPGFMQIAKLVEQSPPLVDGDEHRSFGDRRFGWRRGWRRRRGSRAGTRMSEMSCSLDDLVA